MSESVGWILEIRKHQNFQILALLILLSITLLAIFSTTYVPTGISHQFAIIALALMGTTGGSMATSVSVAESVGAKNALRYGSAVTAISGLVTGILWQDPISIVAVICGFILGVGVGQGLRHSSTLLDELVLTVSWAFLFSTVLLSASLALLSSDTTIQSYGGLGVSAIFLAGFHTILAGELGVSY